jgi:citronellol/citronellal dehydrogenase
MTGLKGRTLLISGASRGIGLEIALAAARDGANVAFLAKTAQPHPRLEGTVHSAAEAIEQAGGVALPMVGDIRDGDAVAAAVRSTVARFGGIDICVNNASAIALEPVERLDLKRYDLMQAVNARGTFVLAKECIPFLRRAQNPHILTLSPPITLDPRWLGAHAGYAVAKFSMTLLALGLAAELQRDGIASNTLWPRTTIATAAVRNLLGGDQALQRTRSPRLYADAAHLVLTSDSRTCTGNQFLCEDVLVAHGITDLASYSTVPGATELDVDLFVDAINPPLTDHQENPDR